MGQICPAFVIKAKAIKQHIVAMTDGSNESNQKPNIAWRDMQMSPLMLTTCQNRFVYQMKREQRVNEQSIGIY